MAPVHPARQVPGVAAGEASVGAGCQTYSLKDVLKGVYVVSQGAYMGLQAYRLQCMPRPKLKRTTEGKDDHPL